ncbi:hypothetical protein DFH27DRAFT_530030 [Peziza echinospora]|nr:hypothetical protein DFH27DRAFT_530030 [Peziza echinospora]
MSPSTTTATTTTRRGLSLLALAGASALLPSLALAQVGAPNPEQSCTKSLCRPIGVLMAGCVGDGASPETIKWEDMLGGNNVTVEDQNTGKSKQMPERLQCFCGKQGLEKRLDNCNACYFGTNQEDYWFTGINNIKIVCGFAEGSSAADVSPMRWTLAAGAGLSIVAAGWRTYREMGYTVEGRREGVLDWDMGQIMVMSGRSWEIGIDWDGMRIGMGDYTSAFTPLYKSGYRYISTTNPADSALATDI